jgi:hypothetical protein
VADNASTATLLEFNSHDLNNRPVDVSQRNKVVRQLHPMVDAETIANYSDFRFVLEW